MCVFVLVCALFGVGTLFGFQGQSLGTPNSIGKRDPPPHKRKTTCAVALFRRMPVYHRWHELPGSGAALQEARGGDVRHLVGMRGHRPGKQISRILARTLKAFGMQQNKGLTTGLYRPSPLQPLNVCILELRDAQRAQSFAYPAKHFRCSREPPGKEPTAPLP